MQYTQVNYPHSATRLPVQRHGSGYVTTRLQDDRRTPQAEGTDRSRQTPSGQRSDRDAYLDMPRADDSRQSHHLPSNSRDGFEGRAIPLQDLTGVSPLTRHFRGTKFESALSQLCRTYGAQVPETFAPYQAPVPPRPSVQPSVQPSTSNPSNEGRSKADIRRASKAHREVFYAVKPTQISPNGKFHKRM